MPANLTARIKAIQKFIGVAETGIFDLATCLELLKRNNQFPQSNNLLVVTKMVQRMVQADDDGAVGPETVTKVEAFLNPNLPRIPVSGSLVVSNKSLDLIVEFEVSSKEVYNKKYQSPIWPGENSGVTIGIGYDLGYYSELQVTNAWGPNIPANDLQLLLGVRGKKGEPAHSALPRVQSVKISFEKALIVFYQFTLPDFARQVRNTFPGTEKLPPDAQGGLLSLVYNRGASLNGPRRVEMKNIIPLTATGDLAGIANEIRKMKRLWDPNVSPGLIIRREKEAVLIENASFNILPQDQVIV